MSKEKNITNWEEWPQLQIVRSAVNSSFDNGEQKSTAPKSVDSTLIDAEMFPRTIQEKAMASCHVGTINLGELREAVKDGCFDNEPEIIRALTDSINGVMRLVEFYLESVNR